MTVTIEYGNAHFEEVIEAAEKGEEIVVSRPGKPNLVLVSHSEPTGDKTKRIPARELLGLWEGQFHVPDQREWDEIHEAFLAELPDTFQVTDKNT